MFSQSPFNCRFEWGLKGVRDAMVRGDLIILVDVLSFSSATVTAVHYGAKIFPYPSYEGADLFAKQIDGVVALKRDDAKKYGGPSLSPLFYSPADKGKSYVLCSPNGATCARLLSGKGNILLAGCFLNARAVAKKAGEMSKGSGITVIACGEQWNDATAGDNTLRPCIEDYLGAGSILSFLDGSKSPEAFVCLEAFQNVKDKLETLIRDCGSGRELQEKGYGEDVTYSAGLNVYETVPVLRGDYFENIEN